MARSSLANSSSKLNLSRRKTIWLQNAVLVGNRMAEALYRLEPGPNGLDSEPTLAMRWNELMVELVEMLL